MGTTLENPAWESATTALQECEDAARQCADHNEGDALRKSAIRKIEQARTLLDSARHDLCNLEGPIDWERNGSYCDRYEKIGEMDGTLGKIASDLRNMKPPTGVFHI